MLVDAHQRTCQDVDPRLKNTVAWNPITKLRNYAKKNDLLSQSLPKGQINGPIDFVRLTRVAVFSLGSWSYKEKEFVSDRLTKKACCQ